MLKKIRTVLLLCVFLQVLVLQGCTTNYDVSVSQLREYSEKMHILFPPSTKPLKVREIAFQGKTVNLKIEIDRTDLGLLINNSPYKNLELSKEYKELANNSELDWWKPGDVQEFLSRQAKLSEHERVVILIDLDKPDKAIIYLTYFTI